MAFAAAFLAASNIFAKRPPYWTLRQCGGFLIVCDSLVSVYTVLKFVLCCVEVQYTDIRYITIKIHNCKIFHIDKFASSDILAL